ncbi:MAG: chemotaxis protein CheX [Bryobacteraceae bacterium]
MFDGGFNAALREAVAATLEEMFFVTDLEECDPSGYTEEPMLRASVDFAGEPSGRLTLCASLSLARSLAADFLAEDEDAVGASQVTDVFAELANIVCGAVLTRTESACTFRLSSPHVFSSGESTASVEDFSAESSGHQAEYAVALSDGRLSVLLRTEVLECCPAEKFAS